MISEPAVSTAHDQSARRRQAYDIMVFISTDYFIPTGKDRPEEFDFPDANSYRVAQ